MKRKLEDENNDNENVKKPKLYDSCPICLNDIQDKNYVITECNHKFCFGCLMSCCSYKNQCPLCRSEIKEYEQKKLPIFKHSDMFNNILSSINNPSYNFYELIDDMKDIIFGELIDFEDEFSDHETIYKNSIVRRLQYSTDLNTNIDLSIIDNLQEFCSKIIIDNTIQMCDWYKNNFNR